MGSFGLVGFVAEFGLLALCVFRAAMALTTWRRSGELASTQNKIPVA
jgi:hypothetical protein